MADPTPPLLSLDTLTERPLVVIDGQGYGLRAEAQFSILEIHRVGLRAARLQTLMKKGPERSEEDTAELSALLDAMCRDYLDAPDEVHKKLHDAHRLRIMVVFFGLLQPPRPAAGAENHEPSIGVTKSPDLSASMVATP